MKVPLQWLRRRREARQYAEADAAEAYWEARRRERDVTLPEGPIGNPRPRGKKARKRGQHAAASRRSFYIGGFVGGSFSNTDMSLIDGTGELAFSPYATTSAGINHDALVYGGFAGFSYDFPSLFVLGGEIEGGGTSGIATGVTTSGIIPQAPSIEANVPPTTRLISLGTSALARGWATRSGPSVRSSLAA